jgi:hypothetical protein
MALAQATASPLPGIAAGTWFDVDIAARPLVAIDVILSKTWRGTCRFNARSASASNTLTVHPVTAANDSRIRDTNGSVPVPTRVWHR